jgi:hypothetical protein
VPPTRRDRRFEQLRVLVRAVARDFDLVLREEELERPAVLAHHLEVPVVATLL